MATSRDEIAAQYGTTGNFVARQSIYRFAEESDPLPAWALSRVTWRGDERVLDMGCGNGVYPATLARMGHAGPVVGADLSEAMLRAARERSGVRVVRADVQALPFRGGCADVVLAMHMLYHVPDIALVLFEARRCLRPDGTLLAATNGRDHLAELHREYRAAVFGDGAMPRPSLRFNLGNGEPLLRACFDEVILHERRVRLSVPEPEPIVAYFDSARSMREKALPAGITWDDALARFEARIRGRIDAEGAMEIHSHVGVWVCH